MTHETQPDLFSEPTPWAYWDAEIDRIECGYTAVLAMAITYGLVRAAARAQIVSVGQEPERVRHVVGESDIVQGIRRGIRYLRMVGDE